MSKTRSSAPSMTRPAGASRSSAARDVHYVGTDYLGIPLSRSSSVNQVAGFPGGRVGQWQNRSDTTLPNNYITDQLSVDVELAVLGQHELQFLTARRTQVSNGVLRLGQQPVRPRADINPVRLDVFSEEIQLTGGSDRIEWLGGIYYWDQTS